jgi:hypothetical protein
MSKVDAVLKKAGPKKCKALSSWIRSRVREMEICRESIQDEEGFDLVALLDDIRQAID